MNRYQRLIAAAWAVAGLIALASIAAWSTVVPSSSPPDPLSAMRRGGTEARSPVPIDTAGLAASAARIRDRDPFRFERKPTKVRYNPWEPVNPPGSTPPATPPPPALVLVGVLGGPPWTALVEGIPGRPGGVLLRVGEETGGVRLMAIRGDTARLSGLDTTWVLTPRRPWR